MKRLFQTSLCAIVFASGSVFAEEAATEKKYSGEINAGYIASRGNSVSTTFTGDASINRETVQWKHAMKLSGSNTKDSTDTRTAEKYLYEAQSDYKLESDDFLFVRYEHEKDKFNGFKYSSYTSAGYGRSIFKKENMSLVAEVGPGYRVTHQESTYLEVSPGIFIRDENPDSESETAVRVAGTYKWKISDTTEFSEIASADVGEEFTVIRSEAALTTQIAGDVYLKLAHTVKRQTSEIAEGTHHSDIETTLSLNYKY